MLLTMNWPAFLKNSSKNNTKYSAQAGFSLIEIMVVMVLLSILMMGATSLFLMNMGTGIRTTIRQDLKEEGLFILNQVEFTFKNSFKVDPGIPCTPNMSTFTVRDRNNLPQAITFVDESIRLNNEILNSSAIRVTAPDGFLNCFSNATDNEKFVEVKFTLERRTSSNVNDLANEPVVEDFTRLIQLRNN